MHGSRNRLYCSSYSSGHPEGEKHRYPPGKWHHKINEGQRPVIIHSHGKPPICTICDQYFPAHKKYPGQDIQTGHDNMLNFDPHENRSYARNSLQPLGQYHLDRFPGRERQYDQSCSIRGAPLQSSIRSRQLVLAQPQKATQNIIIKAFLIIDTPAVDNAIPLRSPEQCSA